jgi:hypothetical protein
LLRRSSWQLLSAEIAAILCSLKKNIKDFFPKLGLSSRNAFNDVVLLNCKQENLIIGRSLKQTFAYLPNFDV